MLLHIGGDVSVPLEKLVMILNARKMQKTTAEYVARAKRAHRLTPCVGAVKSYVLLCERSGETVLCSPISAATLEKRLRDATVHARLFEEAVYTVTEA